MNKQQEAYIHGFCKVASDSGINPVELIKWAKENNIKTKKKPNRSFRNTLGEITGTIGGETVTGAGLGAGIGALASLLSRGRISPSSGALSGMVAGSHLGTLAGIGGMIAAPFTKRRTKQEQREHDTTGRFFKSWIPGVGSYNLWKRIGSNFSD